MAYATVVKKSIFDSAHRNTGFGEGHKCNNIHGHSFVYKVAVRSKIDESTGLSIDFGVVKRIMKVHVDGVLDHQFLNELQPFKENPPSAENIALYIFHTVQGELTRLNYDAEVQWVELAETPTSTIIIRKEDLQ